MESGVINTMCRCCASEGAFKDFKSAYHWMGEEEIYADMLKECFDITLSSSDNGDEGGICEVCITQLRNASNFKKQVILAEDQFKKHVNNKLFKTNIVKVEMSADEDSDGLSGDDGFAAEFEIPIKTEVPEEPKTKKRAAVTRATTSKAKKSKQDAGETSTKRNPTGTVYALKIEDCSKKDDMYICPECDRPYKYFPSLKSHFQMKHINFPSTTKITKYRCNICIEVFNKPGPLVRHKLEVHNLDERYSCNACDVKFLTKCLMRRHKETFHMLGIKLQCPECDYTTYDKQGLRRHSMKHVTSKDFLCRFCKKAFKTKDVLLRHERIHTGDKRKICKVCGERFVQNASLTYHMTKHHPEVHF